VVVSLLCLAISAWVRFKPVGARRPVRDHLHPLAGFAQAVNAVTGTSVGDLVHLVRAINSVVLSIFGAPTPSDLPMRLAG
jgi:hypothetical protein